MKRILLVAVFFVGVIFSSVYSYSRGDSLEFYNGLNSVSFISDSVPIVVYLNGGFYLNDQKHKDYYYPFKKNGQKVINLYGYGIYYDSICVTVSTEPYNKDLYGQNDITRCGVPKIRFYELNDNIFNLKYELPLVYEWGNWLSIRREFTSIICLDSADGIQFDVKVIKGHFNSKLRLAICVVNTPKDFYKHGADEMWWYDDFPVWTICDEGGWISLKAPFEYFEKIYGYGTRIDNREFDPGMIVAYEISIVSDDQNEKISGEILVGNVRIYKK